MKQKEMLSNFHKKLSDLEEEAKERAQNLLQRANKLRMEQEEELKVMSKVDLLSFPPSEDSLTLPLPFSYSHMGQGEGLVGRAGRVAIITEDWLCHPLAV
jgi:hypothetical protein